MDKFIKEKGIISLYHFTKKKNLESILTDGLISRNDLDSLKIKYDYNDELRLEGRRDGICVSISFPNYKMFYKYRMQAEIDDKKSWCLLELDPKVLIDKQCLFYNMNAASKEAEGVEGVAGIRRLFTSERSMKKNYTTNPQAEVIVLEKIEKKYIKSVIFNELDLNYQKENYKIDKNLFSYRYDYKEWC